MMGSPCSFRNVDAAHVDPARLIGRDAGEIRFPVGSGDPERFSSGGSLRQHGTGELWAEQIPLSLRARTFPHSYASLRNAGPWSTRARFTLGRHGEGLRVRMGAIQMNMGIRASIPAWRAVVRS